MEKIRVVQYGVTHEHAAGKILSLKKMTDLFEIVGVVDDRDSDSARFPQEVHMEHFGGVPLITPEEFFAREDIEAVLVEVANDDLVPTAIRCMEKGIAMHVDKPGGTDLAAFDALSRECEKRNIPMQMGYMLRGNTALEYCLELAHKGALGDIFEIQMDMNHCYGGEEYVHYLQNFSGGLMYNLCCHLIDFITRLMGKPESIFSLLKNTADSPADSRNNCVAILEYKNATATIRSCSKDHGQGRRVRIAGTNGVIDICPMETFSEPLKITLSMFQPEGGIPAGVHTFSFPTLRDRYQPQLTDLAKIVRKEIPNQDYYSHDRLVNHVNLACSQLADWNKIKDL